MLILRTIDAHAAGEPLRLIVGGFPPPRGKTMAERREWVKRHADHIRRALMLEPRGHADMYGAVLTEPVAPGSHAGVLFMHNEGYSTMCGHGIIAATTIALERGLLVVSGSEIVYDTPAGPVRARATREASHRRPTGDSDVWSARGGEVPRELKNAGPRVSSVAFVNVPSFVLHPGIDVAIGGRRVRADVAFGGAFYAIVDAEAVGVPIDREHLPELRRAGMQIARAVEAAHTVAHPLDAALRGVYGTIFTGPPHGGGADLRNVTIFADAEVDRSPCGTGTAAVMAVLDAMGLLGADRPFVHESLIGTRFTGRLAGRTQVGDCPAIVPEIEGSAWITGEHTFFVADEDPLREGFRL